VTRERFAGFVRPRECVRKRAVAERFAERDACKRCRRQAENLARGGVEIDDAAFRIDGDEA